MPSTSMDTTCLIAKMVQFSALIPVQKIRIDYCSSHPHALLFSSFEGKISAKFLNKSFTLDRAVATERNMHRLNLNFLAKNAINFNRYDLSYSQNDTILCFDSGTEDKNRLLLFSSSCSALLILRRLWVIFART